MYEISTSITLLKTCTMVYEADCIHIGIYSTGLSLPILSLLEVVRNELLTKGKRWKIVPTELDCCICLSQWFLDTVSASRH